MILVTATLEWSLDPLSDTTPTWSVDLSDRLIEASWGEGKSKELDEPQQGTATFLLDNSDGLLTPEYAGGAEYPPGPRPLQRLRYSVTDGVTTSDEGIWYVVNWGNPFNRSGAYHETTVSCVSGALLAERQKIGILDPPDATSLADVMMHDEPFWLGMLDEREGTKLTAVAGEEGVYRKGSGILPTLGQPPLVVGDGGTSVLFTGTQNARIPIQEITQFVDTNKLTMECWVQRTAHTVGVDQMIAGPDNSTLGGPVFRLYVSATTQVFTAEIFSSTTANIFAESTTTADVGETYHVVGTYDGATLNLYVNGVLEDTATGGAGILNPSSPAYLVIGTTAAGADPRIIDAVGFYEHDISPERVLAHYEAGTARGYDTQLAGDRVESVLTSGLWSEANIPAGSHEVAPVMHTGQTRWDEALRAVKAEMPNSNLYWNGDGDPVYLPWDYKSDAASNSPQATFGDTGSEIAYEAIVPVYDEEIYNKITVARDGGTAQTAEDTTSQGEFEVLDYDVTGLSHTDDMGCQLVADEILSRFSQPRVRVQSLELDGTNSTARTQILTRQIGDCVRVKRRPHDDVDVAVDVITWILGYEKTLTRDEGKIMATYNLAGGFNPATTAWQLGIAEYGDLGETTVLG